MATIETKYAIGDVVWYARTTITQKTRPCPDCLGSRQWEAQSPAGTKYQFKCPRCSENYRSNHALSLNYSQHEPAPQKLTIGSIHTNTEPSYHGDDCQVEYMCLETGVGSGSVYRETMLFPTEEEARQSAQIQAGESNRNVEWIVKQYDQTLKLCDYEIKEADHIAREDTAQEALRKLNWFIRDVIDAEDYDEVCSVVKRYEEAS